MYTGFMQLYFEIEFNTFTMFKSILTLNKMKFKTYINMVKATFAYPTGMPKLWSLMEYQDKSLV